MRVEDVQTPTTCICRTEEGRLLDGAFDSTFQVTRQYCESISANNDPAVRHFVADVKQSMLETIVPKNDSEAVMVVLGKHRGQVRG